MPPQSNKRLNSFQTSLKNGRPVLIPKLFQKHQPKARYKNELKGHESIVASFLKDPKRMFNSKAMESSEYTGVRTLVSKH